MFSNSQVQIFELCLLSRDMVTKWNTQATECCLIGFDTVCPALYLVEKMEATVLGKTYKLKLHSILSGFRLSVDLIDDRGNSIAEKMRSLISEKRKFFFLFLWVVVIYWQHIFDEEIVQLEFL